MAGLSYGTSGLYQRSSDQYRLTPGIIIPTFDEEIEDRKSLAPILNELKEKDQARTDKYLDELIQVYEADIMREYVWTYLRQRSWLQQHKVPRLDEFSI